MNLINEIKKRFFEKLYKFQYINKHNINIF